MIDQREAHQFDENRYQIAMDAAGVGMWDWDLLQDRHFWSAECKVLLGLAPDAPTDFAYYRSLIHPEDRKRVFARFAECYRTRSPHAIEYRIIWPDGSLHWLADQGKFLFDDQGTALRLVGVTWDITARKQAEEALNEVRRQLEQKQAFLQTIMQQIPSGLMIAEAPAGRVIGYNEEASALLEQQYLENRTYEEYARYVALRENGAIYRAEEYPLVRAILTGEMVKQEVMLHQRADGRLIHLSASAAPIYDSQGKIVAGVAIFQDISERYALEQQKDDFICLASHELRTPLTSLKGNLQLTERGLKKYLEAHEGSLTPEEKRLFEKLTSWNERALRQANVEHRLIENLLNASSLQAKGLDVARASCNLTQVIKNAIDDMQTVAQPRTLFFVTSSDQDDIPVMIDEGRIGQVIMNYVKNALKYASEEHPVLVGMTLEENAARVWVKDAGPGLSSEQQSSIWQRFRPVSGLTGYRGPSESGLGLGLSICQELIRLHGGQTGVESALGKGSTFWFTLPLDKQRTGHL